MGFKYLYQIMIILFSESLWIYYSIVLFTSVEWNQLAFFNVTWWVVAAIIGFTLNAVLANVSNIVRLIGNVFFLGFILIQNWRSIIPDDTWVFGVVVSLSIVFIYIHSANFAFHHPKRQQILHRFEANIIFYIVFVVIFTVNQWVNETFHLLFIGAILFSLIGMLLTLSNDDQHSDHVEVRKVGQSSWFTGVVSIFVITLSLICLLFLLNSVQRGLYLMGTTFWDGLKYIGTTILGVITWFFSLLPVNEMEGTLPELEEIQELPGSEQTEEVIIGTISMWLVLVAGFLVVVCIIWVLSKLMKNRQIKPSIKMKRIMTVRGSWWRNSWKKWVTFLHLIKQKWRMRFQHFYHHPIYWHYDQVKKWGKKNGFSYKKHETSQEYVTELIKQIPELDNSFTHKSETYFVSELLQNLNEDYQAIYYSHGHQVEISTVEKYRQLIRHLQGVRVKDKSLRPKFIRPQNSKL